MRGAGKAHQRSLIRPSLTRRVFLFKKLAPSRKREKEESRMREKEEPLAIPVPPWPIADGRDMTSG